MSLSDQVFIEPTLVGLFVGSNQTPTKVGTLNTVISKDQFRRHHDLAVVGEKARSVVTATQSYTSNSGALGNVEGGVGDVIGPGCNVQIWMIEDVVKLRAQLQLHPFPTQHSRQQPVFHQGQGVILRAGPTKNVAGDYSVERSVERRLAGERRCIHDAIARGITNLVNGNKQKGVGCDCVRRERELWHGTCESGSRRITSDTGNPAVIEAKRLASLKS